MKAARLYAARDVRVEEVPVPQPGVGEVLVRVRAVAICASDWRLYADGHAGGVPLTHPIIQGHEFAGEIVEWGPEVEGPPRGTRVAIEPSWHCGHCDLCAAGRPNICRHIVFPSFPPRDGALAEYITCPTTSVYPLPPRVTYTEGALAEPLGVALHALRLACPDANTTVAILGAGAIGICTLLALRASGVTEIAVAEPVPGRRALAQHFGAKRTVACSHALHQVGFEAEVVLECSGANSALEEAIPLARPGGRVIVVGIPHPERVCFDASLARRRELTVIFSRRSCHTLPQAVSLVASGAVPLGALPVRYFSLDEVPTAMELTGSQPGDFLRAIVLPHDPVSPLLATQQGIS